MRQNVPQAFENLLDYFDTTYAYRHILAFLKLSKNLQSSFSYRYLNCWNALPVYVRQSSSLTSFKRQITLFHLGKYLKGSANIFIGNIFNLINKIHFQKVTKYSMARTKTSKIIRNGFNWHQGASL